MSIAVKDNTVVAVEIEDTEGTYKAPQGADSYVQTLQDGFEMNPSKELLERNIFIGSIGKVTPRTGIKSVAGSMPVEYRASDVTGEAPQYDALLLSALGQKRQLAAAIVTETGHSASVLNIGDADIGSLNIGDIVLVKEAGAYHVSPIIEVDDTLSAANVTLLIPADSPFSDNVEIEKFTTYLTADSGHPSLSISKYVESAVLESGYGVKVTSMSLENFSTGQIANLNFGFEGMGFDRSVTASPFSPSYDSSLPPIILSACVYQNDQQIQINSLALSLENTLGFATSTCSENGRISSRPTERNISGTFNPYKQDDSVEQFNNFKCNHEYSLFAFAYIPTLDGNCNPTGEYSQVVAVYLPNCITTELPESDQDGLLVEDISFQATRGATGSEEELYLSFI